MPASPTSIAIPTLSILVRIPGDRRRSSTEKDRALNFVELLKINDDLEHWEYPLGFDYKSEQQRFLQFAAAFSADLNISPKIETGACIQDASFHSQLIFPVGLARFHSLRFSNFGSFITINDDEDVPEEMLSTILELADRFGYTDATERRSRAFGIG